MEWLLLGHHLIMEQGRVPKRSAFTAEAMRSNFNNVSTTGCQSPAVIRLTMLELIVVSFGITIGLKANFET